MKYSIETTEKGYMETLEINGKSIQNHTGKIAVITKGFATS